MTIVADTIAAELALLAPARVPPTEPFGWGADMSCVSDITRDAAEIDPFSALGIAQAIVRRWTTPRGSLPDDPDYGYDIKQHVNHGATQLQLAALGGALRGEAEKDDRVAQCTVTVTQSGNTLLVRAELTPEDYNLQTFGFTFALSGADQILELVGA